MMWERCPWCLPLIIDGTHCYIRCVKRGPAWTRAHHLHHAPLPRMAGATVGRLGLLHAPESAAIRWRSSNTPDYHYEDLGETANML